MQSIDVSVETEWATEYRKGHHLHRMVCTPEVTIFIHKMLIIKHFFSSIKIIEDKDITLGKIVDFNTTHVKYDGIYGKMQQNVSKPICFTF